MSKCHGLSAVVFVAGWMTALGCRGGAGVAPEAGAARSPAAAPAPATPTRITSATEQWRVEGDRAWPGPMAQLPQGAVAVAWRIEGAATIAGTSFPGRGQGDIVVTVIDRNGAVTAATHVGGPGDEMIDALAADAGGRLWLGLSSDGELTLGTTVLAPPPADSGLFPPSAVILTRLAPDGKIQWAAPLFVRRVLLRVAPLPGGDVIVTAVGSDDGDEFTEMRRLGIDGTKRWDVRHDKYATTELAAIAPDRVLASVGGEKRLGLWWLDPANGRVIERVEIEKGPYDIGDRGGIAGLVDGCAFGETGGTVVLDGKQIARARSASQPFTLAIGAGGKPVWSDIADLTGFIQGTGLAGGQPAAHLHVLHTGADRELHRGEYVVVGCGGDRQLIPLYQYKHANDDWKNAPRETVQGTEIDSSSALFVDRAVLISGIIGPAAAGSGALIKFALE